MRPLAMGTGAVQLSSYKTSNECCEKMKPANIFKEAVELAVFKSDWKTVKQLAELYTTTGFSDPEYAGYLKEVVSMGGASRGVGNNEASEDLDGRAVMGVMNNLFSKIED